MTQNEFDQDQIIGRIKCRKKTLRNVAVELKKHFVGLDTVIDGVIKNIEIWYCCPELLTRPVVICLWGLTGTGKTDLVRRLVQLLSFSDRFCEIEMSTKGGIPSSRYGYHNSITSVLGGNPNIQHGQPAVILLDEMQKFRTVDEHGIELNDYKFRDVWSLLGEGKLPSYPDVNFLLDLLWSPQKKSFHKDISKSKDEDRANFHHPRINFGDDESDDDLDDDDIEIIDLAELDPGDLYAGDRQDYLARNDYHDLIRLKNLLNLTESIEEIAQWDVDKRRDVIVEKLKNFDIYKETDYTKCLIFVSGNLDEVYSGFAEKVEEVDINADIFHDISRKINILDVKEALLKRFRPEQIARFGNMHFIYPSLSKKSYMTIIQRYIDNIRGKVKARFGINLRVDNSINDLIYRNGVFPLQGTRPVFSTIMETLENPSVSFIFKAFMKKEKQIDIFFDKGICARIGGKVEKMPYQGALDVLREEKSKNEDSKVLTAVHEAGHALVYAALFNLSPTQIVSSTTSSLNGDGFVSLHDVCGSKDLLEKRICVMLAGTEAERMVFGDRNATWGGAEDIRNATNGAANLVRDYGMDKFCSTFANGQKNDRLNTSVSSTNDAVEIIMRRERERAKKLLKTGNPVFKEVVDRLIADGSLQPVEFQKICLKYGLEINLSGSKDVIYTSYDEKYRAYRKKKSDTTEEK